MKPVAIDLFCGKGGWTNALLEQGFEVFGFDLFPQPDYKGQFIQRDILTLNAGALRAFNPQFIVCSSPCEEFSVHGMKHFHPNPKHPVMGLKLFHHAKALCENLGVPYVMENVRPAQKFVGQSVMHCGPFHLWGTGVPAMFPLGAYKVSKGISVGSGQEMQGMDAQERKAYRRNHAWTQMGSKSKERKAATALAAMIPPPVARAVAESARALCSTR